MALPTQTELEYRLSPNTVKRIYDDGRVGSPDADAVAQLLADAKSKVFGVCRGIYDLAALEANPPHELNRLILDAAVAYAAQRHPEVVRRDWVPLMAQVDADLARLRAGKSRLDVEGTPEPAANQGTEILVGDPDDFDEDTFEPAFGPGTSDY